MKISFALLDPLELPFPPAMVMPTNHHEGPAPACLKDPLTYATDPGETASPNQLPITSPDHQTTPTMAMPTLPKPGPFLGPFLNACICYPFPNFYTEVEWVCYIYCTLFDTPNMMPMQ